MLGYRYDGEQYIIVPEEAEVVRSIFADYLDGKGVVAIMKRLNESGILTQQGFTWHQSSIQKVLRNYTYTGNLLLQTKFRENHLTKRTLVNKGELPQYHIQESHEPIIDIGTYNLVQLEMARRAEQFAKPHEAGPFPFTGRLICAGCGKHYRRKMKKTGPVWICSTYNTLGKAACPSKAIPEDILMDTAAETLGLEVFDADTFLDKITEVRVENGIRLVFLYANGKQSVKRWQDRSRAASWTDEMKESARRKKQERRSHHEND